MGERTAKGIVEAVKDKIPNHVKKLQGDGLDNWLETESSPAKAIVFTDKGTTSPLVKSLAIDFLGTIAFAQVRHKATAEKYEVSEFPSVLLITSAGATPILYHGELTRASLVSFLSQVAPPNPDPAPKGQKSAKSSSKKSKSKPSSTEFSRASQAHKSSDFEEHLAGSSTIVLDDVPPTESPLPIVETEEKPMVVPDAIPPIPTLATPAELEASCLSPTSGNCILVLLPRKEESAPQQAVLTAFAEITDKYNKRKASVIPMYAVPADNQAATKIRNDLDLGSAEKVLVIATNMKRGWWRHYESESDDILDLESFIDAIKLGEGTKSKLPAGFGAATEEVPLPESTGSTETSNTGEDVAEPEPGDGPAADTQTAETASSLAEPEPAETPIADHDEL